MQKRKEISKKIIVDKHRVKPSVKILWMMVVIGLFVVAGVFLSINAGLFGKLPSLQELENPQANLASEIYANDGSTIMGKIYAENRVSADYHEISPYVINALISTEDIRFYDHSGIDFIAIGRAIKGFGQDGGGSTITQQLAKNILGQGRGNVLERGIDKLKEWVVALRLEKNFTKEEIITLYLNRVAWGNVFGIRNASRVFFQKEPAKLSTDEAALLVGMLKGPNQYDPIRSPEAATARRNLVIDRMVTNNVITIAEATKLEKKPLGIHFKKLDESLGIAPYFRSVLKKKLDEWCKSHKNPITGENYDMHRDGLKIYTTIDPTMQKYAEEAMIKHMVIMQKKFNAQLSKNVWKGHEDILDKAMKDSERWRMLKEDGLSPEQIRKTFEEPVKMKIFAWNKDRSTDTVMTPLDSIKYNKQMMQTAFAAMDPVTGEVKAWVGGIDFNWFKYDHVTANRQVGSTFKPLLYTLAISDAGLTPESYIGGRPITLANKTISGGGGTMAYCLAKSLNAAAWDLMSRIGAKKTAEFAHLCGIKSSIPVVPSIALGSADIQLIEMLRAYTMFPNRGFNTEPIFINKIEDKNGNVLESFQPETKQIISEADAYMMYKMMQGVMDFGTGGSMRWRFNIQSDMGGKTGTTNDNTDGWFIGYTPQILAGAWVGCDDRFLHIRNGWTYGGNEMAMPEFAFFMQKIYADKELGIDPKAEFQKPEELSNDPIYADQNFSSIVKKGEGTEFIEDVGNGNADEYIDQHVPVESEFTKDFTRDKFGDNNKSGDKDKNDKKTIGPSNFADESKKQTTTNKTSSKDSASRQPKAVMPDKKNNKDKKAGAVPAQGEGDY